MRPAAENLAEVKILFRESDTLVLWGIPYEMRSGQQPADILRGYEKRYRPCGIPSTARLQHPKNYWLWLGSPGWWGGMTKDEQALVRAFLAKYADAVPNGPNEWARLAKFTERETQHGRY